MEIKCPSCDFSAEHDSSKIPSNGVYFRCPKCQARFFVKRNSRRQNINIEDYKQQILVFVSIVLVTSVIYFLKHSNLMKSIWDKEKSSLVISDDIAKSDDTESRKFNVFKEISMGFDHSLALRIDGSVWAWGSNRKGQLGMGSLNPESRNIPEPVNNLTGITAISAGHYHNLALQNDGTVWAWGDNSSGQLGDGTNQTLSWAPVKVQDLTDVISVKSGHHHSLALKKDGTVWAWGANYNGELGTEVPEKTVNKPIQISNLRNIKAISAGGSHSVAVDNDGLLLSWGDNKNGELGIGSLEAKIGPVSVSSISDVLDVAAGDLYTIAVKKDGTVWQWGFIYQDINNIRGYVQELPTKIEALNDIVAVAAKHDMSMALKKDGSVWIWGDRTPLKKVYDLQSVITIASGGRHEAALKRNGVLLLSGQNDFGQLGDGTKKATRSFIEASSASGLTDLNFKLSEYENNQAPDKQEKTPGNIIAIAAGHKHSVALTHDGTVWTWGSNEFGQLGSGIVKSGQIKANLCSSVSDVKQVAVGESCTIALRGDGSVWGWGKFFRGYLPERIEGLNDIKYIAGGLNFMLALDNSGVLWQLDFRQHEIKKIEGLADIVSVSAGKSHSIALLKDGSVWTWGGNEYGQLGDGTKHDSEEPLHVAELTDVTAIAAGGMYNIVLKKDGTVWTWGEKITGSAADGLVDVSRKPVKVPELADIVAISAGGLIVANGGHNLALKKDGTLWAWGLNLYGQNGNGTKEYYQNIPIQVKIPKSIIAVAAGGLHSLALDSEGNVWAWGLGMDGQIGHKDGWEFPQPVDGL